MQLKLNTRVIDGITVIDCHGRIVFGEESALLRDTVKATLSKANRIILNLHEVSYIDSGGLGTLVGLFTSARSAKGDIKLANLTPRVGQLLQVTKLVTVFDVHETLEQALKAFGQAAKV
ncbi:MAG TPA: STAS domain-containing protein [Clostridia bacterium]|nr:STAS domain-containing protein [Clostridia bacterium]